MLEPVWLNAEWHPKPGQTKDIATWWTMPADNGIRGARFPKGAKVYAFSFQSAAKGPGEVLVNLVCTLDDGSSKVLAGNYHGHPHEPTRMSKEQALPQAFIVKPGGMIWHYVAGYGLRKSSGEFEPIGVEVCSVVWVMAGAPMELLS
jgi:hypothetical protein